jgi:UDP-N-acetylenolpyruvoylglucosamine reductase
MTEGEPLARRTTLRVGGQAEVWVEPGGEVDVAWVVRTAVAWGVPWRVMGRGSNLLVRDGGVRGVVLGLVGPWWEGIDVVGTVLRCGAGARLRDVAQAARRAGLGGLEFLSGIPGSVGGALRMNAGAWQGTTFDRVDRVRLVTPEGEIEERLGSELEVGYRSCPIFRTHVALSAVLTGETSTAEAVEARMKDLNQRRWASQPAAPSAGCMFKNPAGVSAGRLIEELGMKGVRVGGAMVSEVHGNFIVNEGQATARDVLELVDQIRRRAREERGIELETEVEIIGE